MLRWLGKDRQARKRTAQPLRKSVGRFCVFCNISEEEAKEAGMGFEIDHILALALGGKDEPENVGDMCAACHHAKTARMTRIVAMKKLISKVRGETP
jgi:5-methylcytosine-specific restriction endonuclease McrA